MRSEIAGLGWIVIFFLVAPPVYARSELACQAYVLDAYRKTYKSADECWAGESGMKGASEYCCNLAFGGAPTACRRDVARINIDWVFADAGAKATYGEGRRGGLTPFEACIRAQGHNPSAAESIRSCPAFSQNLCALKDRELRGESIAPVGCEQAERNVRWVLFLDDRARLVYDIRRRPPNNDTPYQALIFALLHNPAAQKTLALCRQWVEQFAASNE